MSVCSEGLGTCIVLGLAVGATLFGPGGCLCCGSSNQGVDDVFASVNGPMEEYKPGKASCVRVRMSCKLITRLEPNSWKSFSP